MVCSADDLVAWRDFPKGLRVLLLDEDATSAAETKLKLEAMDYIVSSYCNEKDALEAISRKAGSFHVAIVEVTTANSDGSFRFLEMAKDLPTVAISNVHCLSTMMKCIAIGAAEFLQKPLSEDKLRNIWQHVVHKAFNSGRNVLSKSLEPIKETVVSMLQLRSDTSELKIEIPSKVENMEKDQERKNDTSEENDKFSAPSTPQLVKGGRLKDEQLICLTDKESSENARDLTEVTTNSHSKSKSVDNTSNNLLGAVNRSNEILSSKQTEVAAEDEVTSDNGSKTDECSTIKDNCQPSSHLHNENNIETSKEDQKKKKSFLSSNSHSNSNKSNRRRMKVDWTPELHRRFVQAVEKLGIDQTIPSKILEMMKVEGLTRHNIASHLQKYRMHRRHILPKDDDRRWQPHRDTLLRGYMQKPAMAFPAIHSNCGLPPSQVYPIWGHPSYYNPGAQMWGLTGFPTWYSPQGSWLWKTHPEIHAEAWGCPVMPPYSQFSIPSKTPFLSNGFDESGGRSRVLKDSYDFYLAEDVIDDVVKEAMSKPWLPLPLGLKPPSIDSVLTELQRQGIRTIPPTPKS